MDLSDTNDGRTLCVLSVPAGARVLDVGGGGGGAVAEALAQRGCTVSLVAPDEATVRELRRHCAQALVADLDSVDLGRAFEGEAFDAVVAIGTLQHVRAPGALLRQMAALLPETGRLVATVPNVAHGAVRLELLRGRFRAPGDLGVHDTPLHVFDGASARALFDGTGLTVVEELKVTRPLHETELKVDPSAFSDEVLAEVTADPDALVHEFVFVASPTTSASARSLPGEASLAERLQARAEELAAAGSEARARIESLEELVAALNQRVEELSEQAERASRLEAELTALREDRRHLELDVAVKDAFVTELRTKLAELRTKLAEEEAHRASVQECLDQTGLEASRAVAEARAALGHARDSLAAKTEEADRLRERAAELDRLHHQLVGKANDLLLRVPSVHRALRAVAGRVARRRRTQA